MISSVNGPGTKILTHCSVRYTYVSYLAFVSVSERGLKDLSMRTRR